MTDIIHILSSDDQPPLVLLRQCEQLLARLHDSHAHILSTVGPIIADSSRLMNQANEHNWSSEYLDLAMLEVATLESICNRVQKLINCYQDIVTEAQRRGAVSN